jgi:predicted ATPase
VIASVAFRNFKALRSASVRLAPFNLLIGPNGSGKTSLIQALLKLRTLARIPLTGTVPDGERLPEAAEITFAFDAPHDGLEAVLSCRHESSCDLLQVTPLSRGEGADDWPGLREKILGLRTYLFDHVAIGRAVYPVSSDELAGDGGNLAARLGGLQTRAPRAFAGFEAEVLRLFPEYEALVLQPGRGTFALKLSGVAAGDAGLVPAGDLSQGTLYALALLALAFDPAPPALVCVEELDRGIHPRLLRDVRDILYRLSYPADYGHDRAPCQVIATTHSPLLLDLFRDQPEEVVIAEKSGRAAKFTRLDERVDLALLLAEGGSLGELWYSGILGGVPDES